MKLSAIKPLPVAAFDQEDHPAEEHLMKLFNDSDHETADGVAAARKVGLSWPTILSMLIQWGPKFTAFIVPFLAALKTPVPVIDTPAKKSRAKPSSSDDETQPPAEGEKGGE